MTFSSRRFRAVGGLTTLAAALAIPLSAGAATARVSVAAAAAGQGRVIATASSVTFDVVLRQPNQAALTTYLADLYNPDSPNYHHFLTTAAYAARFGVAPTSVAALRHYLAGFGITHLSLSTARTIMHVQARTSAVEHAFGAVIQSRQLARGRVISTFSTRATLPATLAAHVVAVVGLSGASAPAPLLRQGHATATPSSCSAAGAVQTTPNSLGGYVASTQADLYGLSGQWAKGDTGVGQTIALYELANNVPSDLNTFFTCYGLNPTLHYINVDGGPQSSDNFSQSQEEATLDVEEAGVLAPGATLEIYQGSQNDPSGLDVYQQIADDNTASIVSTSWGTCELDPTGNPQGEQVIFEQMAAQGQTVISAAGDSGSSDCSGIAGTFGSSALAVDDPSSQPLVTGVGGLTVSSTSPLTESVWNTGGGAGGGGVSALWSRPSWQVAPGIGANTTARMVPDLSAMADPSTGFIEYYSGGQCTGRCTNSWTSIGGTSIGAPLVSAMVATAAQSCQVSRLGLINPSLYAMAQTGFVDVTSGSNDLNHLGSYAAQAGYDMASGLGSPSGAAFYAGLCPLVASATTSSVTVGAATLRVNTNAALQISLKTANGTALAAPVTVTVTGSAGTVSLDGVATTSDTFATSDAGQATVTLAASGAGTLTATVSAGGVTVGSVTVQVQGASVLAPPSVASYSATAKSVTVTLRAPTGSPSGVHFQYQLNGSGPWRTVSGVRVTITGLKSATHYAIRFRSVHNGTYSATTTALSLATKK